MTRRRLPSAHPRWKVPYQAPGSKGGFLVVHATTREDAINKAIETHGGRFTNPVTGNSSWRLTSKQLAAIDYGEPVLLADEQAQAGAA